MFVSMNENKPTELKSVNTFADGTAVKLPGDLTYQFCKEYVDEILLVNEDEIASAVLALMEKEKMVAEGSGALSGALTYRLASGLIRPALRAALRNARIDRAGCA
jgi:threonine dehydratase